MLGNQEVHSSQGLVLQLVILFIFFLYQVSVFHLLYDSSEDLNLREEDREDCLSVDRAKHRLEIDIANRFLHFQQTFNSNHLSDVKLCELTV